MLIRIKEDTSSPLYQQIIDQVKAQVADGTLRMGDRLPSVWELATTLRININTAYRAYKELEAQSIVRMRVGFGVTVIEERQRCDNDEEPNRLPRQTVDRLRAEAYHYPWQIEVIPFISFALAIVIPLIYRQQSLPLMHSRHSLSQAQTWWGWYAFNILGLAVCVIGDVYCNRLTIRDNLDNKNNWFLSAVITVVGLMSSVFMLHFRAPGWVLCAWAVLLVCSFFVQPLLRKTLPQSPQAEAELPPTNLAALLGNQVQCEDAANPGEPFYYRESPHRHIPINLLSKDAAMRFRIISWITGAAMLALLWWTSENWRDMAWLIALFAVWELWDHLRGTYFIVTPLYIKARAVNWKRIRIQMPNIRRCAVVEAMPKSDEHFLMDIDLEGIMNTIKSNPEKVLEEHPYMLNITRLLEIETGDGKTHKFRLQNPDRACKLVNAVLQQGTNQ